MDASQLPHHRVANLLITIIHLDITVFERLIPSDGCPFTEHFEFQHALNKLPTFTSARMLRKYLQAPLQGRKKPARAFSWICDSFCSTISAATEDLLLPNWPAETQQFLITRQLPKSKPLSGESMILFHGTRLHFLHSILQTGLNPSKEGLWMAEQPGDSFPYASGELGGRDTYEPRESWTNSPYKAWGVLLVCAVDGTGEPRPDWEGVHAISDVGRIMVKYVLVIPDDVLSMLPSQQPTRKQVLPGILSALQRLDEAEQGNWGIAK